MGSASAPSPTFLPTEELAKIATQACDEALKDVKGYDHAQVAKLNTQIVNNIVASLVKATSPPAPADDKPSAAPNSNPPFRFFVNSVLIQQGLADPDDARIEHAGVRGMHAASGAYWDVSRDGTWSFKYPGAAEKGLDAVLTISWFATV